MPDEAGVASESTTRNCRFGWGRVNLGSDPLAAQGGKAPQCLDNTSGTEAQPEGDVPSAGSGQPLASPSAGSPPPAIDLPAVAVDAVDAGTAAAPEESPKEAQSEPGPHGEEGAPEVVARVPNLEVDGGYVLPNASAHIDTAADSSGNLYVAYEYLDGTDYDIVVGKSVDNGRTWSLYLLGGTTSERHPAMAIDSSNYVYIAVDYTLSGVTYPGYYKTATAGDISSFGSLWYFNAYPAGAANPAISISGGGTTATVYAVWQYIASGSRYTLRYWYSTNGGSSWTTSASTACGTSYSCLYPSIAISISGSTYVTVAWQYDVTGQGDVYVQQEMAGNDTWTTRLSYTATDKQGFPTLASSGANVYFAYVDAYSTTDDDVYYRYSTNGGTSFNASDISVAATGSNERYPSLSASGSAVRVAYSYNSGTSIYLKQSASAYGATWGSAYTMTDLSRPVLEGFRCLDVSFRTALHPEVAWIDVRNSSSNPDPYYSTLDDPPTAASQTWPADAATLYAYAPPLTWSAASDPDGDTVRYWWYIDTANPPANKVGGPVAQLSSLPYYTVPGRTYYWKVVSDDGYRLTSSSVRSFTTAYETDSGTYTEAFTTDPGVTTGTKWSRKAFACLDCFEASPIRWTVSPSGKWARSTTYAWSGTYSAQALYDANSATYDMTTPAALDLRGSTWAYLNTHWRGSSESGYDTLYLQTSPDNSTWTTRNSRTGDNNAGWWTYTDGNIDLSAFAGAASGYARIRFTTDSSNYGSGYGVGWFVDDVEVSRASEWSWMNADPYYYRLQTTGAFVGYTNNLVDQFYSPFIRLPSSGPINLYLRERFTISSGDTGSIWILDTTTGIWERLDSFSGTETNWIEYLLRIPDTYLGKTVVVALILRSDGTGTLGSPEETGGYWDVDTFRLELGPTSVVLKSFKAWPEAPAIHVRWETAQEIDNLGFNLYRSNTRNGPKLKLNQELIPTKVPPGSPFGAVYDYIDGFRLRSGRAYFYWLEDVDLSGYTTMHGPVRVLCP